MKVETGRKMGDVWFVRNGELNQCLSKSSAFGGALRVLHLFAGLDEVTWV